MNRSMRATRLCQKKYEELCEHVGSDQLDAWYVKAEPIFMGHEIQSKNDFIKLVAFAYSWMPTIPEWREELDWHAFKAALQKLKNGNDGSLREVLLLVVPAINNSIVGASKVLYFICPERVAIIDKNVVVGWRKLFYPNRLPKKRERDVAALPKNFGSYSADSKKRKRHINLYIQYVKNLSEWANALGGISTRDIESKLFLLGKRISEKPKNPKFKKR